MRRLAAAFTVLAAIAACRSGPPKPAILVPGDGVTHEDLMSLLNLDGEAPDASGVVPLREARARFERQYIAARLRANRGNLGDTARDLGIERTNLYRKMKQLGLQAPARERE